MARPRDLLDVSTIYHETAVPDYPRGQAILDRFPQAERIVVPSHWNIPSLHGNAGAVEDWVRIKRSTLVLGVKKGLAMRPNGRSAHFIAPSTSNGCAMACAYCYVPRRKGFANPISIFVNVEAIAAAIARHAARQGPLTVPDTIDPAAWVYDLGENGDLSVDALVSDTVRDLVGRAAAAGVDVEVRQDAHAGDLSDEVVRVADAVDASVIVIGLRRRSPVGKLLMGSTAQRILLDADRPVLAVKP